MKANTVAVVSDGSAVLGLGNIGPKAAMPVMEGKAVLFKEFGGVNAVPICLDTQDTEEIIKAVTWLAPAFGGINLEDISAPRCFDENMREAIYKMIQDTVDTYVDMCFSDDVDSEEWDLNEFNGVLTPIIPIRPLTAESVKGKKRDEIRHELKEEAVKLYEEKEAEFPEPEQLRELERVVLLKCIDSKWPAARSLCGMQRTPWRWPSST